MTIDSHKPFNKLRATNFYHQFIVALADVKPFGESVSELRIDVGQGYRVYFTIKKGLLLVLLVGGDKSTQQADIQRAIKLSKEVFVDD